jgi:hypothetical protein
MPISHPQAPAKSNFASRFESCRKDAEQVFGVLQVRFDIIRYHALTWSQEQISEEMHVCVIIHNMIIENGRGDPATRGDHMYAFEGPLAAFDHQIHAAFADFLAMISDEGVYHHLQNNLIEICGDQSSGGLMIVASYD